jgi:predicted dehydrogenase
VKLLVVGTGSIGARHARLARDHGETVLCDLDPARAARLAAELGLSAVERLEDGLDRAPDAVIIATPHASHAETASAALDAGADVLVEKPISDDLGAARQLVERARRGGRGLYVVCNMRFHPALRALKPALAEIGRPLFARAHYGNYLPDMRPGIDYRTHYSAARAEGGVILDVIHELDYLGWLFGPPQAMRWDRGRLGDLEIQAEDYATIGLRHPTGVRSEVHMDYLQRCKRRGLEVAGTEGTILWASEGKAPERCSVRVFRAKTGAWEAILESDDIDPDGPYRDMIGQFVGAVKGGDCVLQTGEEACASLAVALAARGGPADCGHMELAS